MSSSPVLYSEDVQRCATPNRNLLDSNPDLPTDPQQRINWSQALYECEVLARVDGSFEFIVEGGADNGEFPFCGSSHGSYQNISKDDILLEIEGQKIAGYTQRDVIAWLAHCSRNGNPVIIRAVKAGHLTKDLRQYLNTRFQKGSQDHDLQNTIRDNLYLRTVPCTTRLPRFGEINGVDYTFLSVEEFIALERSGNLLESGIYEGNLYGTPRPAPAASAFSASTSNLIQSSGWMTKPNHYGPSRPLKETSHSPPKRNNSIGLVMPGAHASSEGKRRRNRSNVEAMASKTSDTSEYPPLPSNARSSTPVSSGPSINNCNQSQFTTFPSNLHFDQDLATDTHKYNYMGNGQVCCHVNHNGSHWLDPRFGRVPLTNFNECDSDLPFGWERIDDPHYGTYYIDHVNRRTQYENPVLHADTLDRSATSKGGFSCRSLSWHSKSDPRNDSSRNSGLVRSPCSDGKISPRTSRNSSLTHTTNCSNAHDSLTPANTNNSFNTIPKQPSFFTRNPSELMGMQFPIPLVKSSRGLGFTIIGGDDGLNHEFLQIKDVVPYGPAWCDGKLQTGDVLVHVNSICVLGYSHKDIILLFQSISAGEIVHLEVCRGYPLPFDPNDPNTEIVTTVAVSVANASDCQNTYSVSQTGNGNPRFMNTSNSQYVESMSRAAKSMPDISSKRSVCNPLSGNSVLNTSAPAGDSTSKQEYAMQQNDSHLPEVHSIGITKGTAGFGFTIADSSYGQKVKKILDRPRCKQLQEGDVLIEINGHKVENLPHAEVVQILKDCPCGDTAEIVVKRDGLFPPKNKTKSKMKSNGGNSKNSHDAASIFPSPSHQPSFPDGKVFGPYRSKTPTAELYSSRDKDSVVIPRPKTPIVDTRNWMKNSAENNTSSERVNPFLDDIPTRFQRSDFKNGDQLDRETTDYLACDPGYRNQNAHHTWYSNKSHFRYVNSRDFSDMQYKQNETLDDTGVASLCKQFNTVPSFNKNSHSSENTYSSPNSENFMDSNVSKPCDDNGMFDDAETSTAEWKYFSNDTGQHGHSQSVFSSNSNNSTFGDAAKPNMNSSFPMFNSQHHFQSNLHTSNQSNMTVHSGSWGGTGTGKEASLSNNSFHHRTYQPQNTFLDRHSTSFENEHPIPYNAHNSQINSKTHNLYDSESFSTTTVTIYRQASGFGFRIVGGTEEGSQVCVGHIVSGGAADVDGRLRTGDEILAVDGQSVVNSTHQHVVQLMNSAAANGNVTLHVRRLRSVDGTVFNSSKAFCSPYDVTLVRNENEGFGFVLISSLNRKGPEIGRITDGSPADRCGQLQIADVIQAVNGVSILDMNHGDIVSLIKDSGYSITLTIVRSQDNASSITSQSQKEDDSFLDSEDNFYSVELQRETKGFGFSIRGGKEFHNMPLFVLRIAENGPAHLHGRLKVGDQIVEINGVSSKMMTHAEAIELIRQGGNSVCLLVKRNSQSAPAVTGMQQRFPMHMPSSKTYFTPVSSELSCQNSS